MLPNVPEFVVLYYGILRAGAIVVPMNPLLKAREVEYFLNDSQASLALAWHGIAGEAAEGARRAGTDFVRHRARRNWPRRWPAASPRPPSRNGSRPTSRSSSTPRARPVSPRAPNSPTTTCSSNVEVTSGTLLQLEPDDVMFGALPLFHSFGQTVGMNCAIAAGACLTLITRFEPGRALEIIKRDQVTVLPGVPTMYAAILHQAGGSAGDVASLRLCVSGGAAMPVELLRAFEKEFDCMILEGYGLSETSPVASFNHPDRTRKPGHDRPGDLRR